MPSNEVMRELIKETLIANICYLSIKHRLKEFDVESISAIVIENTPSEVKSIIPVDLIKRDVDLVIKAGIKAGYMEEKNGKTSLTKVGVNNGINWAMVLSQKGGQIGLN